MAYTPRHPQGRPTRQGFNVFIGYAGVLLGAIVAVSGWLGHSSGMAAGGVLLAALSYCVMARPYIGFQADSVVISNVLRETTIPWSGVSHATSRGSLAIHDISGTRTTVWAIGAQKPRRESSSGETDPMALARPGNWRPDPQALVAASTSARALCEAINAETIDNPPGTHSGRQVRWLPSPCALLVVSAVYVVISLL